MRRIPLSFLMSVTSIILMSISLTYLSYSDIKDTCAGKTWRFVDADPEIHCLAVSDSGITRMHDDYSKCASDCERIHHASTSTNANDGRGRQLQLLYSQGATSCLSNQYTCPKGSSKTCASSCDGCGGYMLYTCDADMSCVTMCNACSNQQACAG